MRVIPKVARVSGRVVVPASKSFTARALLMGTMSGIPTTIRNALDSDDSRYMLEAIRTIGFEISGSLSGEVTIGPRRSISAKEVEIDVGNAGTAMRFLAGYLAFVPGRFLLTGSQRMRERPIGALVDALRTIDCEIEYSGEDGFPPLSIRGKRMRGGFLVPVSAEISSQFVSSLMMAGCSLPGGIDVEIRSMASRPYIDMTRQILEDFGATVESRGNDTLRIRGEQLSRSEYLVEGDYSSASYWLAAAAATGGCVTLAGLTAASLQGDQQFVRILEAMGCQTEWRDSEVTLEGPAELKGGRFDCNGAPDIVPTLAAIAPLASTPVEIINVANLRYKESDRIAALASELGKLGATAKESGDGLTIEPGWTDDAARVDPHDDHRIAMSFAIAGLARGNVTISDEAVVSKSYPRFWKTLDALIESSRQH
ncbi:MAG TPA: 3-phosphoshikimate 1-carboxyvinyltransferase [Thermoanaerobaculia bacterium]|nr:3-phosphoshikimate 1-carboxyvinyltransferase [Thermoanaerobaculia bacterium]